MSIVALKCPHCYGDLQMDDTREYGFCQYCGTKIMIQQEIVNINNRICDSTIHNNYSGETTVNNNITFNQKTTTQSKYPILEDGHYEGPLLNGKPHGKGIFIWPNGVRYEGDFVNGVIEGFGRKDYAEGYYEGEFKNNDRHGHGIYHGKDGKFSEGEYRDDMKNGHFYEKYRTLDGLDAEFDGDFVNDVIEGQAIITFSNGYIYIGEVHNGKYHGEGVQIWNQNKNTNYMVKFEGHFVNGERTGVAKEYFGNGHWDFGTLKSDKWIDKLYHFENGSIKLHYINKKGGVEPPVTFFDKPPSYNVKFEKINKLLEKYYTSTNDVKFKLNVKASTIIPTSSIEIYVDNDEDNCFFVTLSGTVQFFVKFGKHTIHVRCGKKTEAFNVDISGDSTFNINVGLKKITMG